MDFVVPVDNRVEVKESKKTNTEKPVEYKADSDTNYSWCAWNSSQIPKTWKGD